MSEPIESTGEGFAPGEVIPANSAGGLLVAGGSGWLRVLELQPAGKNRMKAEDYLRGYPLAGGEVLG